jgi:hypothetical protein
VTVRALRALAQDLDSEGYKEGTPSYEREERRRKVDMCKDLKGLGSCSECSYFEYCPLLKAHLRDMYKMPVPEPKK